MPLEVKEVYAGYVTDINVLNGISLAVKDEKITVVLGPNGSGKSTLLKTIYGYVKPVRGKILLDDVDITGKRPYDMIRLGTIPSLIIS